MALKITGSFFALLLFVGLPISKVSACGIGWSLAKGHFDGVDDNGTVYYMDKIGDLKVDKKLSLPIHILFKSNWENNSIHLGRG
jgi:hypothetical protein